MQSEASPDGIRPRWKLVMTAVSVFVSSTLDFARAAMRTSMRRIDFAIGFQNSPEFNWKGRARYRGVAGRRALAAPGRTIRRIHASRQLPSWSPRPRLSPPAAQAVGEAATAQFLTEFQFRHGRVPRILHVGNVANNAYLNAKLLNEAGYDCDVICHDYYHIMACPEWEDADFEGQVPDQLKPDWRSVDLRGFQRPRWFAQGPQVACIEYLVAKRSEHAVLADAVWNELGSANKTRGDSTALGARLDRSVGTIDRLLQMARLWDSPQRLWSSLERRAAPFGRLGWLIAAGLAPFLMLGIVLVQLGTGRRRPVPPIAAPSPQPPDEVADPELRFSTAFPDRADQLVADDWMPYAILIDKWAELFSHYDIVQAYATDVVYPMLSRKRPYLGFEHGTLRTFTLGDSPICRLTALGYQQADHVLITNGDCLEYAQKIDVRSFTAMVHPIDDKRIRSIRGDYDGCHRRFGAKYLFLCPLRHDWAVKGTDKYIRALPAIIDRVGRDCRVIMVAWGAQLEQSRELAMSLGVDDVIEWVEPLSRVKLIELQKSVDVVFDQIALPHFGATAPQAIAAGVPVIMSYDPASTAWIIDEPAPILSAWTVEEIVDAVETALDPAWRSAYAQTSRRWFETHHSGAQAVGRLSQAYRTVCLATGIL
jgi:glycosyltransferase involved in cell wall biosynthesis